MSVCLFVCHYIFLLERKKGHTCTVGMVRKVCPSRKLCFIYIVVNTNIIVFLIKCKINFQIISLLKVRNFSDISCFFICLDSSSR
ncbi:hypothetical protein E0M35_06620 [Bacillus thuringiensis]|uniref:Uncharacterized protein n=1 Tax=Bacillus thuringiensis TaxID=1428 RepID=A0A9W3VH31_BACTU|nr:hypothetical protein D7J84_28445 [Bacillus thuringiensis]PNK30314.1 hypothetical protein CBR55_30680 [Bacillus thuringiensis]TBX46856.1 hypothetical protein E0M35_06620 [Bacillus thuringiensis]